MDKKNVLFVIPHLNGGGAEKVLMDILHNFDYSKYNIDLLLFYGEGTYLDSIPKEVNTKIFIKQIKAINKVPGKIKDFFEKLVQLFGMKMLYKLIIKKKYDVEIAFLEGLATKFIAASNNEYSKKITWVHSDLISNPWSEKFYKDVEEEVRAYSKYDNIVCVSKDSEKAFRNKFANMNTLSVIHNPLDVDKIKEMANEKSVEYNKFTLCSVGRLVPQKGYDRLIIAFDKVIKSGIDCNLKIIGTGGEKEKLEKMIKQYGLTEYVELVGFTRNPYKYIKNSHAFICSSVAEGFSLVVGEALILNKPIITTRCAGPVEMLEDGKYGMVVENSVEGIYEGIKEIYNNEEKRNYYIEKSNERVGFFSIEDKMEKIYSLL